MCHLLLIFDFLAVIALIWRCIIILFFGYCLILLHQRLEESVLSEEKKLTVQEGTSLDAAPKCLPARVREIVTKNLSESCESLPPFLPLTSHSSVF